MKVNGNRKKWRPCWSGGTLSKPVTNVHSISNNLCALQVSNVMDNRYSSEGNSLCKKPSPISVFLLNLDSSVFVVPWMHIAVNSYDMHSRQRFIAVNAYFPIDLFNVILSRIIKKQKNCSRYMFCLCIGILGNFKKRMLKHSVNKDEV